MVTAVTVTVSDPLSRKIQLSGYVFLLVWAHGEKKLSFSFSNSQIISTFAAFL